MTETPDVHVDWHMTPDEWEDLRGILLRNTGYGYVGRLEEAGALKPWSGTAAESLTTAEKCRAVKHGVVDLQCEQDRDHDREQHGQPGTWHKAVFTEHREVGYGVARHVIDRTETVEWEPVDHITEAVKHMMTTRNRSTS